MELPGDPKRLAPEEVGAVFVLVSALVVAAYHAALQTWFASDDFLWLEISRLDSVLRSFMGGWGHGPFWRPIPRVSLYLDRLLFGTCPSGGI